MVVSQWWLLVKPILYYYTQISLGILSKTIGDWFAQWIALDSLRAKHFPDPVTSGVPFPCLEKLHQLNSNPSLRSKFPLKVREAGDFFMVSLPKKDLGVSRNRGFFTPQIIHLFIGFSLINHPFWWFSPYFWFNTHLWKKHQQSPRLNPWHNPKHPTLSQRLFGEAKSAKWHRLVGKGGRILICRRAFDPVETANPRNGWGR